MSASALALRGCCVGALSTSSHGRRSLTRSRHTGRVARGKRSGAAPTTARSRTLTVKAAQQDDEFAVFRFTLGIPGFDDEDVPRVIGFLGASLLVVNHLASSNPSDAQARTELIGAGLAAACIITPTIGRRLNEGNAGVSGGTLDVAGGEQVFAFSADVDDAAKADLAWGTFALLTQTNAQGAILHRTGGGGGGGGGVVCARGSVRLPTTGTGVLPGSPASIVAALSDSIATSGAVNASSNAAAAGGKTTTTTTDAPSLYFQDRGAIDRAGANTWDFLPQGVESVLIQPVVLASGGEGGSTTFTRLMLISDKPRAFSKKQRAWVAAVADKLAAAVNAAAA